MKKVLLSIYAVALLSGCGGHIYTKEGGCLTCLNNPVTGNPINHDGKSQVSGKSHTQLKGQDTPKAQSTSDAEPDSTQGKITFTLNKQIDILAIKIKDEFNFYSAEEIRRSSTMHISTFSMMPSWKWESVSGAYYRMASYRDHGDQHIPIDIVIEKVSDSSSKVVVDFWAEGASKAKAQTTGKSLKARILKAASK